MNTNVTRNIAAHLHALDSAQGAHLARINKVDPNASQTSPLGKVVNSAKLGGAFVSTRYFVSSAASTAEEKKTQTAYFRLHGALSDCGVDSQALLADYNATLRAEAEIRKAMEAGVQAVATVATVSKQAKAAKVTA